MNSRGVATCCWLVIELRMCVPTAMQRHNDEVQQIGCNRRNHPTRPLNFTGRGVGPRLLVSSNFWDWLSFFLLFPAWNRLWKYCKTCVKRPIFLAHVCNIPYPLNYINFISYRPIPNSKLFRFSSQIFPTYFHTILIISNIFPINPIISTVHAFSTQIFPFYVYSRHFIHFPFIQSLGLHYRV